MPMSDKVEEFSESNLEEIMVALNKTIKNIKKLENNTEYTEPYLKEIENLSIEYNKKFDDSREAVKELLNKIYTLNYDYISKIDSVL